MIFTCTTANLICILDLFNHHREIEDTAPNIGNQYKIISTAQLAWLIFVCSISFSEALGFSISEIFRRSEGLGNRTGKGGCEFQFEGILLAFLVIFWLPSGFISHNG